MKNGVPHFECQKFGGFFLSCAK